MEDARLDFLTLRMKNLLDGLRGRADELDNEAVSAEVTGAVTEPGRTPDVLRVIAAEFRHIADWVE